jgi:hypothetical protein
MTQVAYYLYRIMFLWPIAGNDPLALCIQLEMILSHCIYLLVCCSDMVMNLTVWRLFAGSNRSRVLRRPDTRRIHGRHSRNQKRYCTYIYTGTIEYTLYHTTVIIASRRCSDLAMTDSLYYDFLGLGFSF